MILTHYTCTKFNNNNNNNNIKKHKKTYPKIQIMKFIIMLKTN